MQYQLITQTIVSVSHSVLQTSTTLLSEKCNANNNGTDNNKTILKLRFNKCFKHNIPQSSIQDLLSKISYNDILKQQLQDKKLMKIYKALVYSIRNACTKNYVSTKLLM